MTREEAEEYAKEMTYRDAVCNALQGRCIPYRKATLIKLYELLDRLEQEPCEDAISREATLKPYNGLNDEDTISVWLIRKNIEQQPPVNPQPKTGHWISLGIQGEVDGQTVQVFTCSECGAISIFRIASGNIVNGDICANCGCRMVEPQESEGIDADSN